MDIFAQLAFVLGVAAGFGILARILRQPPLIGYVVAGIVVSATAGWTKVGSLPEMMALMGKLGVTLLLFLAGLELPLSELRKMGKTALITGTGQIVITSIVGFGLSRLLGFDILTSVYLGVGLTFGSTIMVVKLLSESGDLQSLPGKLAVGYLLVQDFVAIGFLVVLSGLSTDGVDPTALGLVLVKGAVMVAVAIFLSEKVMGRLVDYLAKSTELLFIGSIGWCLAVSAIVSSPAVGFSTEIGGLLAGLALANVMEQAQIISRIRPLRDFFLTWFFVYLGFGFHWGGVMTMVLPAIIFSIYVLVGNPLIVMGILGWLGYHRRTYFLASLAVGQVSEFSLVILAAAATLGQIEQPIVSLMTIVALVTMTGSTYLMSNSRKIYEAVGKYISWFENAKARQEHMIKAREYRGHVVLFGHNRVGQRIRPALEKVFDQVVVVDFNPQIIDRLRADGIDAIYGDMSDRELYERLGLFEATAVVSTVPDVSDNVHLLRIMRDKPKKNGREAGSQLVILTATDQTDADRLYKLGASYVLVPHTLGGDFLHHVIEQHGKGESTQEKASNLVNYLTRAGTHANSKKQSV